MSSKPKKTKFILLLILTLSNNWIWHIQKTNLTVFILLLITTFLILFVKLNPKNKPLLLLSFCLLLFFQYQTNQKISLSSSSSLETDTRLRRTNYYPSPLRFIQSPRLNIFSKLKQNFFSTLDQNIYFFAYHPRQNNNLDVYPKFSFLFLPFFLIGLFRLIKQKQYMPIYLALASVLLITLIGDKNSLGIFTLFPFITFSIYKGFLK